MGDYETLLPLLQRYGAKDEEIFLTLFYRSQKKQEKFLEFYINKVDLNYINYDGALHKMRNMVHYRDMDMLRLLLRNNARIDMKDSAGDIIVFFALKGEWKNDERF